MTRIASTIAASLLIAATAGLSVAHAADKAEPKQRTRADVIAELAQARANGEMNFAEQEVMPLGSKQVRSANATAFAAAPKASDAKRAE